MPIILHFRRNVLRNRTRALVIVVMVGLTLGVFLVLSQVGNSIVAYTGEVEASVPNIITVQPANNFIGGGYFSLTIGAGSTTGLDANASAIVAATPNVVSVQRVFTQPLDLSSATSGATSGGSFTCGSASNPGVLGEDTTSQLKLVLGGLSGAGAVDVVEGRSLASSDENSTTALVSQAYATATGKGIGSNMDVNGTEFTVVGIFSQSCYTLIFPYPAAASALGITQASILYVVVNQYQNLATSLSSLQSRLGSSFNVQILANADRSSLQGAISAILLAANFGEYAALASGAGIVVVVFAMINSRRTKEFGLLKALGFGNAHILAEMLLESLVFTVVGLPVALAISYIAGPGLAQTILGGVGASTQLASPGSGGANVSARGGSNPFLQGIHFAPTLEVVLFGLAVTLILGLLGGLYPAVRALRLRPTEALRHE
ncbi:MAG: ABC transporter permease [Thaumarchaeota archaeon]|nr:ABC transporter permease [Nitrososphaerota archaeon]